MWSWISEQTWGSRINQNEKPDAIVHTAAQPSHDRAAAIPFDDFDTNAWWVHLIYLRLRGNIQSPVPVCPFIHK